MSLKPDQIQNLFQNLNTGRRFNMSDKHDSVPIDPFNEHQLHTLNGAARLCGVSSQTMTRWKDANKIGPWIQFGRRWYIRGSDIKRFIDGQSVDVPIDVPQAAE
jgi:hypothetical protein